ncbi:MAG: hypothetical protein JRJ82_13720 [Deltaproteobacteria bacterium]|nr:hypothetical protein [Deltaproteobacteria bacterium]
MPRQTFPFSKSPQPSEQDRASQVQEPIIAPEGVFRIERAGQGPGPRTSYAFKVIILLFIFTVLLVGGGFLMHYLSKHPIRVANAPEKILPPQPELKPEASPEKQDEKPPGPVDAREMEMAKRGADQSMANFVGAREDLDAMGGAQWGGETYARMEETSRQADGLYLKKEYASASKKYNQALAMVRALAGQSENALGRLLGEGNQALAEGKGKRAKDKFGLALMIDPASQAAKKGLARADTAEAVTRLLSSGKRHESRNNLPFAFTDYQQAGKLDPESVQAQRAFQRVKDLIAEDEFRKLMSTGLTALHREDFDGARASFLKAQGLRPGSQEVRDALSQVDQAVRLARMKNLQKEALDAEQSEDWDRALTAYMAVLEVDPRVRFAVQGKERSLAMIRLSKRVAFYLNKPEVLESDQYLEKAGQLLSEADGLEPKGPRFRAQVEKLNQLVQTAQIPLKITLESDNLTQVAVYRVGRLGAFLKKDLTLRPGSYTIVGTRNGYKDVRQRVVLKPGEPLRVTIICLEKI